MVKNIDNGLWDDFQKDIAKELKKFKTDFLRGPVIAKTTCPSDTRHVSTYIQAFKSKKDKAILDHLKDPEFGQPYTDRKNNVTLVTTQSLYYIKLMKDIFHIHIPTQITHVVDIGGGYGNMYRILNNMGYLQRYQIIDFPIMHRMQKYYTDNTCSFTKNLEFIDLNMKKAKPEGGKSLLIATHSINEMPLAVRTPIEPYYKNYDYIFINHNKRFNRIDNVEYFAKINALLETDYRVYDFQCTINQQHYFKLYERNQ